jgi:hypothetical protein
MMTTTQEHELALITQALDKDTEPLLQYIGSSLDALVAEFSADPQYIPLEIPTTSLRKSAEKHFSEALLRYAQLIERHAAGDTAELPSFITFYGWFAKQGMTEYAHHWQLILMQGGCADCGSHSH